MVELSKIGLPMLCSIMASTASPLLGSTLITATPLPVICAGCALRRDNRVAAR